MHLDVLQSPDRPVPMTPTVARGGSPSGFAKVADRGKGLEIGIGIGGRRGGNEGAGKPESKFGGRGGGDREILGMRLARSLPVSRPPPTKSRHQLRGVQCRSDDATSDVA